MTRFAWLTAFSTWLLIGLGGLVTSKGVGMAVPDWPTTYGYNMFLFPVDQWIGGIFYEHSHRLFASVVGLLTAILAGWIWLRESTGWPRWAGLAAIVATLGLMGVRTQTMFVVLAAVALGVVVFSLVRSATAERPLRWLAVTAFAAVLVQGVLGGLRVTAMADELGIIHGTLAQLFLILLVIIALRLGWLGRLPRERRRELPRGLYHGLLAVTVVILLQLVVGAVMRHQHAGLAVPDFPLAHGQLYPATDPGAIAGYNAARHDYRDFHPITPFQVHLHMAHRFTGLALLFLVPWVAWRFRKAAGACELPGRRAAEAWMLLIGVQVLLGIVTVLKNKPADIATAHVMTGALCLVIGAALTLVAREFSIATAKPVMQSRAHSLAPAAPQTQS